MARLWTCNRNDITDRFPDIVAAAIRQVPDGVVLDGELVILGADGRLSFDALQQRLVTSPAKSRAKAAELPASYAAFDVLAVSGVDLRTQRWTVRRQRLEQLSKGWLPPLQLTPVTDDVDEAAEWFEVLPAAMGVEGLVVKGAASRYTPGRRDAWVKVNSVGLRVVRFSFDAWMWLVRVLRRTGSWCATGVADGRPVPLRSLGNRSAGLPGSSAPGRRRVRLLEGERQLGMRLNLRMMRSKIRAGTMRCSVLTAAAVEPAVRRSFGFGSVAAARIILATTAGSSPLLVFFASTSS